MKLLQRIKNAIVKSASWLQRKKPLIKQGKQKQSKVRKGDQSRGTDKMFALLKRGNVFNTKHLPCTIEYLTRIKENPSYNPMPK